MPYDKKIEEYKEETGKGFPMRKDMAYWNSKNNPSPEKFVAGIGIAGAGLRAWQNRDKRRGLIDKWGDESGGTSTGSTTSVTNEPSSTISNTIGDSSETEDNKTLIAALQKEDEVKKEVEQLKKDKLV